MIFMVIVVIMDIMSGYKAPESGIKFDNTDMAPKILEIVLCLRSYEWKEFGVI